MNEPQSSWTMGTDPSCDLCLNHAEISGTHCQLSKRGSSYYLEDSNSANGTFVNGKRIKISEVRPADQILLAGMLAMPWPDPLIAQATYSIGSDPSNDVWLNHPSVSDHHAQMIVDPNGQCIFSDLSSEQGTWLGTESIKMAIIDPNEKIRLGRVAITPSQIAQHGKNAGGKNWISASLIAGVTIVAAMLLGLIVIVAAILYSRGSDDPVAQADPSSQSPAEPKSDLPPVSRPPPASKTPAGKTPARIKTNDRAVLAGGHNKPAANANPTVMSSSPVGSSTGLLGETQALAESDRPSSGPSANQRSLGNLSTWDRVSKALFLIVVTVEGNRYDFATAWAASPQRLITNAHVVESLQNGQYDTSVVHLDTGAESKVIASGMHPKYVTGRAALIELATKINEATMALSEEADTSDGMTETLDQLRQWKEQLPWSERATDAYDAGWLEIDPPIDGSTVVPVKPMPIQARKRLRLVSTSIEIDSAFMMPDSVRAVNYYSVRAVEPVLQDGENLPRRWFCEFDSDARSTMDWQYFLYDGCPILDLQGRLAGMYLGRKKSIDNLLRVTSDNSSDIAETENPEIEMVPLTVIETVTGVSAPEETP